MELSVEGFALEGVAEFLEVGSDDGLQISVEGGGRGALEFANFRQYLRGRRDVPVRPDFARGVAAARSLAGLA